MSTEPPFRRAMSAFLLPNEPGCNIGVMGSASIEWSAPPGAPGPEVIGTPPVRLRLLFWAFGWRLPRVFDSWVRANIESPRFQHAAVARVWVYGTLGVAMPVLADHLIYFRTRFRASGFIFPVVFLGFLSAYSLSTRAAVRRRTNALVTQGLLGASQPPGRERALRNNTVKLVVPVVILAAVFGVGISVAVARHAKTCPPGASDSTASSVPVDEHLVAPQGYVQQPDSGQGLGPLDIASLTEATAHPGVAADTLRCNGFMTAYARTWTATSGSARGIYIKVVEFQTSAGANNYARIDVVGTGNAPGASRVALPQLPGATEIDSNRPDSSGYHQALVIGSSGRFVFVVQQFSEGDLATSEMIGAAQAEAAAVSTL